MTTLNLTLDTLATIVTPERTSTWQPIPHTVARRTLLDALDNANLPVTGERIVAEKDGSVAYGVFSLGLETADRTWNPEALWFNAHDKSRAYTLGLGERVSACTNGCVWAETVLKTKRTSGIFGRMGDLAADFAGLIRSAIVTNEERRAAYATNFVGENWARVLTVKIAEAGVIPSSKILPVVAEFLAPSFEYEHAPNTLLGLQSAVTHSLKSYSPAGQHDRSLKLTGLLDAEANLV